MSTKTIAATALIVTRDRVADLTACVESLLSDPRDDLEVVVVANGATDAVQKTLTDLGHDSRLVVVSIDATSPSLARNVGVARARGEIVHFLDDDVFVPLGVVSRAIDLMRARPDIGIVGGPNLTPDDDPDFAKMAGALLGSRFGSAIARPRYARTFAGPARESDLILCNLVIRRSLFGLGLAFPRLFGGEENALLGQATSKRIGMWYEPSLAVFHRRRATMGGHVEQMIRYGEGRANALRAASHTFRIAYFVPVAFGVYLLSLPIVFVVGPIGWLPLAAYLVLDSVSAIAIAIAHRRAAWILGLFLLFPITHLAYGWGLARRLASRRRSPFPRTIER